MNAYQIMEEIMNVLDEDIHSAIDKKYPKESGKNKELHDTATTAKMDAEEVAKEHALGKRPEPAPMKGGWDIRTWEIPAETPEEREYSKKETDYDIKQIRKEFTKNKTGDNKTRSKQFPKSYKDVGVLGEPDAKELGTERAARKALGKRKAKMNKNEALEIMEAIINEVSVKRWKEAAANSLDKRKEAADITAKNAKQSWDDYDRISRKHPEDEPQLYRLAQANDEAAVKAEDSADHAYAVTRLRTHDKANANKAIKAARKVADKRDDEFSKKPDKRTFLRMGKADQLVSADPVKSRTDEALSLMEQICDFADNLFELDYEEKQNISPNEISRVKKNKKGERVEVVSVADELFPYEGDAKQQFNQKVLAKINDMIEGTGSLEDLIQFVRAGAKAKASKAHEGLNETVEKAIEKKYGLDSMDAHEYGELSPNRANDLYGKVMRAKYNLRDKGQGTSHNETKNSKGAKKNEEEFYNKVANRSAQIDHLVNQIPLKSAVQKSKDRHYKKVIKDSVRSINKNESLEQALSLLEGALKDFFLGTEKKDPATKSAVGRTLRGKEATYNKHVDDEIKYTERAKGAKGYRAQVNQEKADDAGKKAAEANKDLRKTKGEYLDTLRKDKGLSNPQAHAVLKRAVGESVQEMLELVEGLFVKDNRGDLLDDIDTALGSPVKKKIRDIKNRMTGCKETKVHEAFDLMEEIINEISDKWKYAKWDELNTKVNLAKERAAEIRKRFKNGWSCYTYDDVRDAEKRADALRDRERDHVEKLDKHRAAQVQGKIKRASNKEEKKDEKNE